MELPTFEEVELRVLGVLIEKSLTQPAYYPMTVNAITIACNQKTNREPVTEYGEGDVSDALSTLRHKQWIVQAEPERNSRSVKFRHCVEERTGWNAAQRALVAELLLRGPQTLGELRSRASRMTHLESQDYARDLLKELEAFDPPIVLEMEREPGKAARRFAHLLGGSVPQASNVMGGASVVSPAEAMASRLPDRTELLERVERLEAEVAELRSALAELREEARAGGLGDVGP
jgi:uncharacterized protein